MSDFKMQPDEIENQIDAMLDQLGPDPLPAGFTVRTMTMIRPNVALAPEPFRLHWSDFIPALVAAIVGVFAMIVWLGADGVRSFFGWMPASTLFASTNDLQVAVLFAVIGLAVAAIPLFSGDVRQRASWFLTLAV